MNDLKRQSQAIGLEWEMENVHVDSEGYADLCDAMMLRLDHELAPGGYSWIFQTGVDTAKVGLCYIQNESYQRFGESSMSTDDYLERWLDTDPRLADTEKIDGKQHRGSAHIQMPSQLSTDNFMAIDDTVPTIDPLWGEGIHKCMESARVAAITADHCLTTRGRDTSAERISVYDQLWRTRVAPNIRSRIAMTQLLYLAPNDRYDRLLSDLKDPDQDMLAKANGDS